MTSIRPALFSILLAAVVACGQEADTPDLGPPPSRTASPARAGERRPQASATINPRLLRRFRSIRSVTDAIDGNGSETLARLGQMLFFETRLSLDRGLSCNSCHRLDQYGVDHEPTSVGHLGVRGRRNAPTVYNAAGHLAQFWDGRSPDVEAQAKEPILYPAEMDVASPADVIAVLKSIPGYQVAFQAAFPAETDAVTYDNIGRAIGSFERRLRTRSRWDAFLDGDSSALSRQELQGLKVFADVGCIQCHSGKYLGASMFQKAGAVEPWPNQQDQGRYEVTKQESDRMEFKVPSLRNVARTAPYFHDGSTATLEEAVRAMGRYQLGLSLTGDEVVSIVAWLGSLTGELPTAYIAQPALPPDGPRTAQLEKR
jgi:cytochrome c peroxidase